MSNLYSPVVDGFSQRGAAVRYTEQPPPNDLADVVHVFWELRTLAPLSANFQYHAVPDACVNLLFNQIDLEVAGITALHTEATTLNLGTVFHYVGVQLFPGVWQGDRGEIQDRYVGGAYQGALPLVHTNRQLAGLDFSAMGYVLADLVRWCLEHGQVRSHPLTATILSRLDAIRTVADMATLAGLSTRQLQRTLRQITGFSPHDLLKVLRLQQSFRRHHLDLYADQSHFTTAFRRAVGYTPGQYRKAFGVRFLQDGIEADD
ncbi:MAG: AraC family transcriptional regulator [Hydrogenophaga sp.]|jgi:AraC-like DNA-binding protein|nr:AraC family transcriptional regulator [Hydrogenophaga sp.]